MDKVYLLSIDEARDAAYGFDGEFKNEDHARRAYVTEFCIDGGESWWLRSPGGFSTNASHINVAGRGDYDGRYVGDDYFTVRPVLHLSLSSSLFSYAGTVKSDGTKEEVGGGED